MGNRSLIIALVFFVLLRACSTDTSQDPPSTSTPIPTGLATKAETPIPLTFQTTVTQPTYCYNGPAENYPGRTIVAASIVVDVLGTTNGTMDWFMVQAPSIGRCWIQASMLFTQNIDAERVLKFIDVRTTKDA